jgi:hypothetical protein
LTIIDFIGYGASASCWEGAAASPAAGNNFNSLFRANNGCTDTDNNTADFAAATVNPRNSASPINDCLEGSSLPINFSFFEAAEKSDGIQLSWTNDTEENVAVYVIERSADGRIFNPIGQLTALNNDQTKTSYVFMDVSSLKGDNYYRIKAVESDGNKVYTAIVRISTNSNGTGLVIRPNPLHGTELSLQINNLPKGKYIIKVHNISGQEITTRLIAHAGGAFTERISLGQLIKGIYCLQINGSVQMQKHFLID